MDKIDNWLLLSIQITLELYCETKSLKYNITSTYVVTMATVTKTVISANMIVNFENNFCSLGIPNQQMQSDNYIDLIEGIRTRNQEIDSLSETLDRLYFVKGLHEEDNLRLRAIITDMQYNFESVVGQKNIEISRLTGRVRFLEEEMYRLNKLPQNKFDLGRKEEFDPSKLRELERQLKLKDTQIQDIQNEMQLLKQQMNTRIQEATVQERKKVQNDEGIKNLPFLVENENLKKENAEFKRLLEVQNQKINELTTKSHEDDAELQRRERKLREYLLLDKMRGEEQEEFKKNLQPVYVKVSEDKNLLDGLLALLHYIREAVCDLIFEIFIRSANQAFTRKQSSMILFTINTKELKSRNMRGLVIVLYLYRKMKHFVKIYFPFYGKLILNDHMARIALGEEQYHLSEKRDGTNLWVEQCLAQIQNAKIKDADADYQKLFKLLSLRYRTKYPLKGEPIRVDLDVRVRLENKICQQLLKIFIDE